MVPWKSLKVKWKPSFCYRLINKNLKPADILTSFSPSSNMNSIMNLLSLPLITTISCSSASLSNQCECHIEIWCPDWLSKVCSSVWVQVWWDSQWLLSTGCFIGWSCALSWFWAVVFHWSAGRGVGWNGSWTVWQTDKYVMEQNVALMWDLF